MRLMYLALRLDADAVVTAATLAGELQVTVRTIYRDLDALAQMGLAVKGTQRLGYTLEHPLELPPLLLTRAELRTLIAGATAVKAEHPEARALLEKVQRVAAAR
jgi:predicted DNA-binding transcriptional regulator YafY